jgi:hypothetical protein
MEVGQFDRPLNAVSPSDPAPASTSLAQANQLSGRLDPPDGTGSPPLDETTAIGRPATGEAAQRRGELIELFEDLIPAPAPAEPPAETTTPPATPEISIGSAQATPEPQAPAANAMTVPLPPPPPPAVPAAALQPPPPPAQPIDPFTLAPEAVEPPPVEQPIVPLPDPAPAPAAALQDDDEPAISRAGSVMAEFGVVPKAGSAGPLPPQDAASARPPAPVASAPAIPSARPSVPATTRERQAEPQEAAPPARRRSKPAAAAAPRPSLTVVVINETGRPHVAEDYRSVLSQMGYRVLSVQDRAPQGGAGETVIAFNGASRGQASALARRLPGRRVMRPTSEDLPAGAVVIVR